MTSWRDERLLVQKTLVDLSENQKVLVEEQTTMKIDIAVLKTKAITLGAISGTVVTIALNYILKKL